MPANAQLTPWPDGQEIYGGAKLPRWDSLSLEQKKLFIKQADVYGAYQAYTDHEIGRVIQAVGVISGPLPGRPRRARQSLPCPSLDHRT
jgi:arylsulfatase A-like enzyme